MISWVELSAFLVFAIPITVFDLRELRIPDALSLGGIAVLAACKTMLFHAPVLEMLACVTLGFGVFWVIRRVTGGKLGLGDAKYSAFIALSIGLYGWFMTLFVASITGLACALILIATAHARKGTRIPFAPFLTLGALVTVVMTRLFPGGLLT